MVDLTIEAGCLGCVWLAVNGLIDYCGKVRCEKYDLLTDKEKLPEQIRLIELISCYERRGQTPRVSSWDTQNSSLLKTPMKRSRASFQSDSGDESENDD